MRSLKSGLFAIAFASLSGIVAVVGCSADGGGAGVDDTDAAVGSRLVGLRRSAQGRRPRPPDAGKDAGKKDSGPKPEAGVDAGPPPPVEGTACTDAQRDRAEELRRVRQGRDRLPALTAAARAPGAPTAPATTSSRVAAFPAPSCTEDCGNCGKVTKTCTQYCAYSAGACTGQPANSCVPGTVTYTNAGCAASTYRSQTCGTELHAWRRVARPAPSRSTRTR